MTCTICGNQYCEPNICYNARTKPLSTDRVCSLCGTKCINIRKYNKDCAGRQDGVTKSTYYILERDRKFMEKQR